jgi:hypothetical protein
MADYKRAHSPETNGNAGAIVKKQKTDDGSIVTSTKEKKEEVRLERSIFWLSKCATLCSSLVGVVVRSVLSDL